MKEIYVSRLEKIARWVNHNKFAPRCLKVKCQKYLFPRIAARALNNHIRKQYEMYKLIHNSRFEDWSKVSE